MSRQLIKKFSQCRTADTPWASYAIHLARMQQCDTPGVYMQQPLKDETNALLLKLYQHSFEIERGKIQRKAHLEL